MEALRITIIQSSVDWEDKDNNLRRLQQKLTSLQGTTEIAILPEMFSTGFTMNTGLAETTDGNTIHTLTAFSRQYGMALYGSFICREEGQFFNRAFFITPTGERWYYDKYHLFRMGDELKFYSRGKEKNKIINYLDWNICLQVCYDLRFPEGCRNIGNAYDLLLYAACWPQKRRMAWDTLLRARAIENQCYLCGVNRVGTDGYQLHYNGGSVALSYDGSVLTSVADDTDGMATITVNKEKLLRFRQSFPAWMDAEH